jgi:acyl-CoA synthetase (AMP-forming)/AMP-acid ligase II
MLGLMMKTPLLLSSILTHAAQSFSNVEIVSRTPDRPDHVTNYEGLLARSSQLANALNSLGLRPGDRVASLAWNGYRHLELYYGISGTGAVCHTVNPRLFVEQIIYIINHAEDRVVFFDLTFVDLVRSLVPKCPTVEKWIYLGEEPDAKAANAGDFPSYEDLLVGRSNTYEWPQFDENTACGLCYGTMRGQLGETALGRLLKFFVRRPSDFGIAHEFLGVVERSEEQQRYRTGQPKRADRTPRHSGSRLFGR